MLYWLDQPSSENWAMRFGMPLLDLPPAHPLSRLVVIADRLHKVLEGKAVSHVIDGSLLHFRLLLRRYKEHLLLVVLRHLHYPNGRVSLRGFH